LLVGVKLLAFKVVNDLFDVKIVRFPTLLLIEVSRRLPSSVD
jgi:hypothetical protein